MRYALPVLGYVWLGNLKSGKRTSDNDYWPSLVVTCGHLYLLLMRQPDPPAIDLVNSVDY